MRAGLRVPPVWTRISVSVKFAAIIAVAGVLIAIVPLSLANNDSRDQATQRAADKAGIVVNLVAGQQQSLASFATGMAEELSAPLTARRTASVAATLARYSQVNTPSDVIGVSGPLAQLAVREGAPLGPGGGPLGALVAALSSPQRIVAGPGGVPWLIASAPVGTTLERTFIARPIDVAFIRALDGTVTTSADPAGVAVVSANRVAVAGSSVLGHQVVPGTSVSNAVAAVLMQGGASQVVDLGGQQVGVAAAALSSTYAIVVTTQVSALGALWQPIAILLGLIVVTMGFIVVVVQTDLQRPLRRLDRAVAALARDEYDLPMPRIANDEIGRLAASFEEMRRQLRATVTGARARAVIATELNSPQPLETALTTVCEQLRDSCDADTAFIVVSGSEMTDSFAVSAGSAFDVDVPTLLAGEGPVGSAFRHSGPDALLLGAVTGSDEARHGLGEYCTTAMRMGAKVLGVLGVARARGGFSSSDASLVSSSAEQVALSLERYRFIAMVQRQASIDDLTGLYNHRFLIDYLGQQVALAERLNTPLAILVIDLDHFKTVNDTFGHPVGDLVLTSFGDTLVSSIRRADLAARYGGEEFIVVMSNTAAADARHVAEKIRAAAEAVQVPVEGGRELISVSVSIGGAAYPEDTTSAAELLAIADAALYDAKRAGRNRVCMAGERLGMEGRGNVTSVFRARRSAQ